MTLTLFTHLKAKVSDTFQTFKLIVIDLLYFIVVEIKCAAPPGGEDIKLAPEKDYFLYDVHIYECESGFETSVKPSDRVAFCTANGNWSKGPPDCFKGKLSITM